MIVAVNLKGEKYRTRIGEIYCVDKDGLLGWYDRMDGQRVGLHFSRAKIESPGDFKDREYAEANLGPERCVEEGIGYREYNVYIRSSDTPIPDLFRTHHKEFMQRRDEFPTKHVLIIERRIDPSVLSLSELKRRKRQVRDAFNKCKDPQRIEEIAKVLGV